MFKVGAPMHEVEPNLDYAVLHSGRHVFVLFDDTTSSQVYMFFKVFPQI